MYEKFRQAGEQRNFRTGRITNIIRKSDITTKAWKGEIRKNDGTSKITRNCRKDGITRYAGTGRITSNMGQAG